ncbi:hypothetical protein [Pedobacter cryoconitis]|uniref:Ankyrin repeat protein n=1 Tax=Pedobacter cryoconitis TaxID=188932 RepID=A0A327S6X8_9SPHI|nr:hypothetical protein [Pedobacter cryoconitis]RAJ24651.1 hypothetical protein LY11_04372 [Pedobacter cryoconitis]
MNKALKISRKEYVYNLEAKEINPISSFFASTTGKLIQAPPIALSAQYEIFIDQCEVKDTDLKLLFTTGLFELQNIELCLCLPKEWEIRRFVTSQFIEETFMVDLLKELTIKLERKKSAFKITEGLFLDRNKAPWNKLSWEQELEGLVCVNYNWNENPHQEEGLNDAEEMITIYTLIPVYKTEGEIKDKLNEILISKDQLTWDNIAFPLNRAIALQNLLNDGVTTMELPKIQKAVEAGAEVNRGYIEEHWQIGFYTTQTILTRAFDTENVLLIKYLVENGAEVPVNALAFLGGWGKRNIFEYLINKGADINSKSVEMSALERAKSFKNIEGFNDLIALGAVE